MDNINRTPRQESSWERFKENAADKVQVLALSFAKKMEPAIKTIGSIFSTAKKTDAFFRKGVIGQALVKTTGLSVAEVAAAQGGAALAAYPARAIGKIAGASLLQTISTTTVIASTLHLASIYTPETLNFQNLRQVSIWKGILTLVGLSTLIGLYINYKKDLEEMGEGLGSAIFEHLGSIVGSIIAGYQVSKLSSGLSFEEYLKRNVQQLGAVAAFNYVFTPNPWVKMPYDLIVGMLAYNAGPIKELIKIIHRNMCTRERDLALRIQEHLQSEQEAKLTAARGEREAALEREEDVTTHDERIRELEKSSIVMRSIYTNLSKILNTGFKNFNKYQEILTNNQQIARTQFEFIDVSQKAGNFEKKLEEEGIESTDEYRTALQTNPDITEHKEAFARDCSLTYALEKTKKREAFENALRYAINKEVSILKQTFNFIARSTTNNSILPMIDDISEINSIEETLFGFSITDPINTEIAKTLIRTHMKNYLTLSLTGIALEAANAITRTTLGLSPSQRTLITKNEELQLIEGLLRLVVNHYERSIPDSTTARWVGNALPTVFTGLREGIRPAFQEWRSRNESGELVELENYTDDQPTELTDNDWIAVDMPEDDGIGRSLSVEFEEIEDREEVYFDAEDNFGTEESENFVDATDEGNPEETILDMTDVEILDNGEIAEAHQAEPTQRQGVISRISNIFKWGRR